MAVTIGFQSPRSGKFVSDTIAQAIFEMMLLGCLFQSPRSGKFVSNCRMTKRLERGVKVFQSPRSGKFVSNLWASKNMSTLTLLNGGFNPLDRGNLYQIEANPKAYFGEDSVSIP